MMAQRTILDLRRNIISSRILADQKDPKAFNVLHVSDMNMNLVSENILRNSGFKYVYESGKLIFN